MSDCWQKPTDLLQLMVNAHIDDSETDQVSVDEYTGTVIQWSHKGTVFTCWLQHFYAVSLNIVMLKEWLWILD